MLEISRVMKSYRLPAGETVRVLSLEYFRMEAKEKVALVGPSGSGKSTLLNIISGMVRPTEGKVTIHNTDIGQLSEAKIDAFRAKHIGYVFQSFHLAPGFSALENVMLSMQFANVIPRKERRKRAEELLEKVGLAHRMRHRPDQLSNGEQQRVSIARALANRPSLVLADEPTASLDYDNARIVLQLLTDICGDSQAGLLLCTHDLTIVEKMERVISLNRQSSQTDADRKQVV